MLSPVPTSPRTEVPHTADEEEKGPEHDNLTRRKRRNPERGLQRIDGLAIRKSAQAGRPYSDIPDQAEQQSRCIRQDLPAPGPPSRADGADINAQQRASQQRRRGRAP